MIVTLFGGTGFVGTSVKTALLARGDTVIIATRQNKLVHKSNPKNPAKISSGKLQYSEKSQTSKKLEYIALNDHKAIQASLGSSDAVINLAGANIASGRWTARRRREILASRVNVTRLIQKTLPTLQTPPSTLINASAIGVYAESTHGVFAEQSLTGLEKGRQKTAKPSFLNAVCSHWEAAFMQTDLSKMTDPVPQAMTTPSATTENTTRTDEAHPATLSISTPPPTSSTLTPPPPAASQPRRCLLRIGVVLSTKGGMLKKMIPLYQKGLGGVMGSGRQGFSWISLEDLTRLILYTLDHPPLEGVINACAPQPVQQQVFARLLARALGKPTALGLPTGLLRLLMGELSTLMSEGAYVIPQTISRNAPQIAAQTAAHTAPVMPTTRSDEAFTFHTPTLEKALKNLLKP